MNPPEIQLSHPRFLTGVLVLVVANICFSAKAVLVKLLYRHGVDVQSAIALRMLLALPFYAVVAWHLSRRSDNVPLSRREWLAVSGLGILNYYVSSMLDFMGLQYITASVERLILFTYPTIVLLLSALLFGQKITRTQVFALLLTYSGVVLAFASEQGLGVQKDLLRGGALVFGCAVTFAVCVVYTGVYVRRVGSAKFTSYAVMAATLPTAIQIGWHNGFDLCRFSGEVYVLGGLLAIVATVIPTFLLVEGIRVIGAGNSGIIGFVGPVATIALGYIFLDEPVGSLQLLGTAIVLAGVGWLSWQGGKPRTDKK